ncbi:PREDICTED: brevican core protein [Charadrius vociferus]|uniref:brevican core protein n=1 Tax=Charadrius vociferus TaxID=50402 RepID=UPI0005212A47|nr:PREDICTED: brevican core protein [Charadrius vociferus]
MPEEDAGGSGGGGRQGGKRVAGSGGERSYSYSTPGEWEAPETRMCAAGGAERSREPNGDLWLRLAAAFHRQPPKLGQRMASALPLLLLWVFAPTVVPEVFGAGDGTEDLKALQVSIPRHPALDAVLAGDITIPCLITYLGPQPTAGTAGRRAVLGTPRVKWTFISEGREVEILVARGDRVKVSEDYRLRASLPIFHQRYTNASLLLTELRPNDSGIYRCDVQHGIEDGHDILDVKVKGTWWWGAAALGAGGCRGPPYPRCLLRAQQTPPAPGGRCTHVGGGLPTPEQLYAAYLGGYEQCDAGWIADQTVRYPIHTPREACYGDMNGFPGVRNYGVVDPEDMYDVYCYAEDLPGYPIVTPRERCGGALPGVKTIFLFRNQTGFPDALSRYDAYCFRGGCVPNPCLNGGTCTEDGTRLTCLCLPGYGGSNCERPLEKCSTGWDSFQGACYKHFSTRRSWEDAETQCRHYGGHLATILTPEEQDFINGLAQPPDD